MDYEDSISIDQAGYDACLRGMPREGNPQIPDFYVQDMGYAAALAYTRDGASRYWYQPRIDTWFRGWDRASAKRALDQAAADIPMVMNATM